MIRSPVERQVYRYLAAAHLVVVSATHPGCPFPGQPFSLSRDLP